MLVVGLTGGIGVGKSTVAALFAKHGVPIIDADVIARELTQPGQVVYKTIVQHFGQAALAPDGTLDRAVLRKLIFEQADQRHWLENQLHPLIREQIEAHVTKVEAPYCIIVIPLLTEVGAYPVINRVLVIDAPEALQIERAISRDRMPLSQVQAILKTQARREERLDLANDVLVNDGNLAELDEKVKKLHDYYLRISLQ